MSAIDCASRIEFSGTSTHAREAAKTTNKTTKGLNAGERVGQDSRLEAKFLNGWLCCCGHWRTLPNQTFTSVTRVQIPSGRQRNQLPRGFGFGGALDARG
jgi:hypothetical protein